MASMLRACTLLRRSTPLCNKVSTAQIYSAAKFFSSFTSHSTQEPLNFNFETQLTLEEPFIFDHIQQVTPIREYVPRADISIPTNQEAIIIQCPKESEQETFDNEATINSPMLAVHRTYQPHEKRRRRKHGFLARLTTHNGRRILNRRKAKNRSRLVSI